uniref:Uncharacterized protein n=1 Tax=Trichobilharzia regenti TaxID=157069 RepID=A0AA85JAC5_TRIRE
NVCVELHGTFDLFVLTFHVFDLWCKASSSCASNNDDGGPHIELCIVLLSLNDFISNFTSVFSKVSPSVTGTLKIKNETTVNGNNNNNISDDDNDMNYSTIESSSRQYQFVVFTRQLVMRLSDHLTGRLRKVKCQANFT